MDGTLYRALVTERLSRGSVDADSKPVADIVFWDGANSVSHSSHCTMEAIIHMHLATRNGYMTEISGHRPIAELPASLSFDSPDWRAEKFKFWIVNRFAPSLAN